MSDVEHQDEDTVNSALEHPWHLLEDASTNRASSKRQLMKLLEQVGVSDRRVREDYEGRFAIELLQNAHDACHDDDGRVGRAWFVLTESSLLVGNEGRAFDGPRIAALTRLGASTKRSGDVERHVIGYKGIGFSSVFSVTNRPQISSSGLLFGFDRSKAEAAVLRHLGGKVAQLAVRCFPFRLDRTDFEDDAIRVDELHRAGAVTVVRLPLDRKSTDEVRAVLTGSITAEALLFMPHLNGLSVDDGESSRSWTRIDGKPAGTGRIVHLESETGARTSWLAASTLVDAPPEAKLLEDDIWHSVEKLNASVALPWKGTKVDPDRGAQPLHVYFPTDDQLGRSLLAHGDFFLHASRRFIQDTGHGGKVSAAVAEGIAALTAELAESVAARGGELLHALAYRAPASGYGLKLNALVDERLREAKIVRSHARAVVDRARELSVLQTDLDEDDHRRLFDALRDPHTLVAFSDDVGRAADFLVNILKVDVLLPYEVAQRLSMPKVRGSYDDALQLLKSWYETLSNSDRRAVRGHLTATPTVRDESGKWRRAAEVRRYVRDLPTPPLRLRPARLKPPTGFELNAFLNSILGVEPLTADTLFNDVLAAVADNEGSTTALENRRTLRFLLELSRKHPTAFDATDARLSQVRVPVRSLHSPTGRTAWRPAGESYFPRAVSQDELTELLYAPFNEAEFLDLPATELKGEDVPAFCQTLGVSAAPRLTTISVGDTEPTLRRLSTLARTWVESDELEQARCPRHGRQGREFSVEIVDRIDRIIESRDIERIAALASVLAQLEDPFGPSLTIPCAARGCYQMPRIRGLQHWLINSQPWIPVLDSGRQRWATPSRAWFGVPPDGPLLPRSLLDDQVSERLGCVSFNQPPVVSIELMLRSLARRHPNLTEAASGVTSTAALLADLLESAPGSDERPRVPLPSIRGGAPCWSSTPMVQDLPALDRLPSITLLGPGEWPALRSRYRLRAATEVVEWEIRVIEGTDRDVLLDDDARAELVALLTRRSNRGALARLVGRLTEHPVESLYLDLSYESDRAQSDDLPYFLSRHKDPTTGNTTAGTLFTTPSARDELFWLAGELAAYLGTPHTDLIHSYFTARDQVLARERIDADRIAEAKSALATYPNEPAQQLNIVSEPSQIVRIPGPPSQGDPLDVDHTSDLDESSDLAGASTDSTADGPAGAGIPPDSGPRSSTGQKRSNDAPSANAATSSGRSSGTGAPDLVTWTSHEGGTFEFSPVRPKPAPFGSAGEHTPQTRATPKGPNTHGEGLAEAIVEVDDRAVKLVRAYGESLGARVARVDHQNLGWDLEFHFEDSVWPVEVKGMAQESRGFVVTRNELRAARAEPDHRFAVVTGLRSGRGLLAMVKPTDTQLEPTNLEPLSWLIQPWRGLAIESEHTWAISEVLAEVAEPNGDDGEGARDA